jgi:hypothetical protein
MSSSGSAERARTNLGHGHRPDMLDWTTHGWEWAWKRTRLTRAGTTTRRAYILDAQIQVISSRTGEPCGEAGVVPSWTESNSDS